MKTIDLKFTELCDEIDYWKDQALKYKQDAEYWQGEYSSHLHESFKSTQRGIGQALMLALSVKDNPDGSLSINKEDRKKIANQFK